jgi:hypothetical protein
MEEHNHMINIYIYIFLKGIVVFFFHLGKTINLEKKYKGHKRKMEEHNHMIKIKKKKREL